MCFKHSNDQAKKLSGDNKKERKEISVLTVGILRKTPYCKEYYSYRTTYILQILLIDFTHLKNLTNELLLTFFKLGFFYSPFNHKTQKFLNAKQFLGHNYSGDTFIQLSRN